MPGSSERRPTGVSNRSCDDVEHGAPSARDRAPDSEARTRRADWAGRPDRRLLRRRRRRTDSRLSSYQNRWLNDVSRLHGVPRGGRPRPRRRVSRQSASSCSALYQSALISTALPRRGVTTQSSIFASIQVSVMASRALPQQPVGRIDADVEARAGDVMRDEVVELRQQQLQWSASRR